MIDKENKNCSLIFRVTQQQNFELENICSATGITRTDIVVELLHCLFERIENPNSQRFFEFCDRIRSALKNHYKQQSNANI